MSFSPEHASKLPDNISGIQTNPDDLLSSASIESSGYTPEVAQQMKRVIAQYEKILDASYVHSVSVETQANDNKAPVSLAA